jgi:hypothetical protein
MLLLVMFVLRSEASPKSQRIFVKICSSDSANLRKSTTSSAYMNSQCWRFLEDRGCRRPKYAAFAMRRFTVSITKMNNMGDSGSPCLRPRRCVMDCPGTPFNKICVEEVASIPLTISHQILPNPSFSSTSIKKVQDTESKAFVISSFNMILGCF